MDDRLHPEAPVFTYKMGSKDVRLDTFPHLTLRCLAQVLVQTDHNLLSQTALCMFPL